MLLSPRVLLASLASLLPVTWAASLQHITSDFGANPRNVGFYIFVPDKLAVNPPILVNPHWCHGDATAAYSGSQYATLASKYGYIVIYPDSPNTVDKCWDVSSAQTLTHNGGGDSLGIVSMVKWTLQQYNADATRVFVTGVSSGAMMTTVLIGAYPDIFAAGSAFSGVPFGCFAPANNSGNYDYWNGDCATGLVTHTPAEWKALVQAAYPAYNSWRPKMQIFHGTVDETLNYTDFLEEVKQWNAVFGFSQTPTSTTANTPVMSWTKYVYGNDDWFEAFSAGGVPHNIPNQEPTVMDWFDLTCTNNTCFKWGQGGPGGPATMSTTSYSHRSTATATVTSSSSTPSGSGAALWGQCGGIGYTGPTYCASGTCVFGNAYYSQCQPS